MAQTNPEIRLRLDREERTLFEQVANRVGMNANEMVKVFIKRSIAAGGFPFEMRAPANDVTPAGERSMLIHGVSVAHIADVAQQAALAAHASHIEAGRIQPSVPDRPRAAPAESRRAHR
ncbi:MAG: type II toxin-antitoxin system RelB/DinJ family antitoxin [Ideonella sp.]|nr:type II toxin-antitoxin system RelB/DinJ family antitoxin [Ideonella sp.]MCC7458398.1 type II toxin-antitoxin system RelB/DinJ family antitoxin [Nitrospira sp.]